MLPFIDCIYVALEHAVFSIQLSRQSGLYTLLIWENVLFPSACIDAHSERGIRSAFFSQLLMFWVILFQHLMMKKKGEKLKEFYSDYPYAHHLPPTTNSLIYLINHICIHLRVIQSNAICYITNTVCYVTNVICWCISKKNRKLQYTTLPNTSACVSITTVQYLIPVPVFLFEVQLTYKETHKS